MGQDIELSEQLMKEGFTPLGAIEDLTEEGILSNDLFEYLFSIENLVDRERLISRCKTRAKQLKVSINSFNVIYKQYKENYIKSLKSKKSNETNFTDCKYKLKCGNWIADDTGVYKLEYNSAMEPIKVKASSIPILPIERIINIDTNTEKVKIMFFKDGKWNEIIVEKNTIVSKSKIIQLANKGIEVTDENAKNLINYFADVLELNTFKPKHGITHLGWVGEDFVPYTDKYIFDSEDKFKLKFQGISSKGDYELWKSKMRELRSKSKTLKIDMAASFASPLLKIFNVISFIVHVWGKTNNGKTVGQMVALSIWGNPSKKYLFSTFDNTKIANEKLCGFLRNLPLVLDELQLAKGVYTSYDEFIYAITEGKGKERGTVDGGLREVAEWNNTILISGEEPITASVSDEGAKSRVIEIEEKNIIIENGNEVVNFILENHGFAGKEFIEIIKKRKNLSDDFKAAFNELKQYTKYQKQAQQIAVLYLANKISSEEIFGDTPLTIDELKEYLTTDIDKTDRIIDIIIDTANANINNFYYCSVGKEPVKPSGQIWGRIEKTTDGNGSIMYYDFIPKKLYEILENNNTDWNAIKGRMAEKGYVVKDEKTGKYQLKQRIDGTPQRVIRIKNIYFDKE